MKKKSLLTTAVALLMSVGIVSCSSNKEKMEKAEKQRQEEIRELEKKQAQSEEKARKAQMEADQLRAEQEAGASYAASHSGEKPWRDQQISRSDVKEVQSKLNNEGFNAGPVDGLIGPKTMDGISSFQAANDLPSTGELNQETVDALGVDIDVSEKLAE